MRIHSGIAVNTFCCAMAEAESPNMTGNWNIEVTFGDGARHSLRFEAQTGGNGTLLLTDPPSQGLGSRKVFRGKMVHKAKEMPSHFSGPMEFLLGNVGREAGH